jgi:hypothetical protein
MEVSPSRLRGTGAALHEMATEVRSACHADRTGPGDPGWATGPELHTQASAWDGYLDGLADRLDDAGDRLTRAADGYAGSDSRARRLLGRLLC